MQLKVCVIYHELVPPRIDLDTARRLGARVASCTRRWMAGAA